MENIEESSPLRITPTVRALSSALRGKRENVPDSSREHGDRIFPEPEKLWFKESSAKNLRNRDFLSPTTMLNTLYADGQVPPAVMSRVLSLRGSGILPVAGGEVMGEGLRVRVDRAAAFKAVLAGGATEYLKPSSQRQGCVVLNCPAMHPKPNTPTPDTLTLGQLRTVLLADHMGALLRRQGFAVSYCPTLPEDSDIIAFLRALGIDWPTTPANWTNEEREEKIQEALENSVYRERETEK
ncbi:DALR anticodon-binding domain-containing protein 3, partial [Larimichthys crocea]